jgi:hypothetical protein
LQWQFVLIYNGYRCSIRFDATVHEPKFRFSPTYCGVCHIDAQAIDKYNGITTLPFVLGHCLFDNRTHVTCPKLKMAIFVVGGLGHLALSLAIPQLCGGWGHLQWNTTSPPCCLTLLMILRITFFRSTLHHGYNHIVQLTYEYFDEIKAGKTLRVQIGITTLLNSR